MLEVALTLLKQGNRKEADRVRQVARRQRTISTLLMAEAEQMESSQAAFGDAAAAHRLVGQPRTPNIGYSGD